MDNIVNSPLLGMSSTEKVDTTELLNEAFIKITQLIIQARHPLSSEELSASEEPKKNLWFNLAISEIESLSKKLKPWVKSKFKDPLFIPISWNPSNTHQQPFLIEQWRISYTPVNEQKTTVPALYQHLVILIRSLYSYLRALPAFGLFKYCTANKLDNLRFTLSQTDFLSPTQKLDHLTYIDQIEPVYSPYGKLSIDVVSSNRIFLNSLIPSKTKPKLIIMEEYDSSKQQKPNARPIGKPTATASSYQTTEKSFYGDTIISTSPTFSTNISQEAFLNSMTPPVMTKDTLAENSILSTSESGSFARVRYSTFSPPIFKDQGFPLGTTPKEGNIGTLKDGPLGSYDSSSSYSREISQPLKSIDESEKPTFSMEEMSSPTQEIDDFLDYCDHAPPLTLSHTKKQNGTQVLARIKLFPKPDSF